MKVSSLFPEWLVDGFSRRPWMGLFALLSITLGIITYGMLGRISLLQEDSRFFTYLLIADLGCLFALTILVVRRLVRIWHLRRDGKPGSKLHSRMVVLFGAIAGAPTLLITIFSVLFFHYGIEQWFDKKFATGMENASYIAQSYFEDQKKQMAQGLGAGGYDLAKAAPLWHKDSGILSAYLKALVHMRQWKGCTVYKEERSKTLTLIQAYIPPGTPYFISEVLTAPLDLLPPWALDNTKKGNISVLENLIAGELGGLHKFKALGSTYYLLAIRDVSAQLLDYARQTHKATQDYKTLESHKLEITIAFSVIFGFVSFLMLLGSIGIGLMVANALARPIGQLVAAALQVSRGDLTVRVDTPRGGEDLKILVDAFNQMVQHLQTQKNQLLVAYHDLQERSSFIESVLAGVSSGVMELSAQGVVREYNARALEILHLQTLDPETSLFDVMPEASTFLNDGQLSLAGRSESQVTHVWEGHQLTLYVRLTQKSENSVVTGYVMTFDDLTQYLQDQRKAAWSDVARRIAHEIKNPLTPIQLSAERLKRRCGPKLEGEDAEMLLKCCNTIIRQVETIGAMVQEFSNFARLPAPVFKLENLTALVRDLISLQQEAYPTIRIIPKLQAVTALCDSHNMTQILTNLLKNAVEALQESQTINPIIEVGLRKEGPMVRIIVGDNGPGWPTSDMERLTEPYYTTRPQGTGLGLSIVARMIADHGGQLILSDDPVLKGALVTLDLPLEMGHTQESGASPRS